MKDLRSKRLLKGLGIGVFGVVGVTVLRLYMFEGQGEYTFGLGENLQMGYLGYSTGEKLQIKGRELELPGVADAITFWFYVRRKDGEMVDASAPLHRLEFRLSNGPMNASDRVYNSPLVRELIMNDVRYYGVTFKEKYSSKTSAELLMIRKDEDVSRSSEKSSGWVIRVKDGDSDILEY